MTATTTVKEGIIPPHSHEKAKVKRFIKVVAPEKHVRSKVAYLLHFFCSSLADDSDSLTLRIRINYGSLAKIHSISCTPNLNLLGWKCRVQASTFPTVVIPVTVPSNPDVLPVRRRRRDMYLLSRCRGQWLPLPPTIFFSRGISKDFRMHRQESE
jgi:hypothetical protein